MANGLELREPFLDINFMEHYLKLPGNWRNPVNG